jgi:hypothetical protein
VKYLVLVFALLFLSAKAEPILLPVNTPYKADVPVVIMSIEDAKELQKYVRSLEGTACKRQDWKSTTQAPEESKLSPRKEG